MKKKIHSLSETISQSLARSKLGLRSKLIAVFLVATVIPLILLSTMIWRQSIALGDRLVNKAVSDSSAALNDSAVENIERLTTDLAQRVAEFLYARDGDVLLLASLPPSEAAYRAFIQTQTGRVMRTGDWVLADDGSEWVAAQKAVVENPGQVSTNLENNDVVNNSSFHYRPPEGVEYDEIPLYDEITFIDLEGNELIKVVSPASPKVNYPLSTVRRNVSQKENTYLKAETYFAKLGTLKPGEIAVSDVIGAYVGTNYIGMYTPAVVEDAARSRGYEIPYDPAAQAYAGRENPNGQRFEGIVRWATPVKDGSGTVIGYVTIALNHDHIMELVDHTTPMTERYTQMPSAFEGNYAFIWDYQCRSIVHPRHHSIAGIDPETGDPQVPWLETSIYDAWQASGIPKWTDFIRDVPTFDSQSRSKKPAAALTRQGLVGLDGRYLNNAPQCTGWMDLTKDGGSGSFYIMWSGLYKLTTAAAIPYYTGQYAPSEANGYSRRGFGFVAIGAGMTDFTRPAEETKITLTDTLERTLDVSLVQMVLTTVAIAFLVLLITVWVASFLTDSITKLIHGVSRFRAGERQFRFKPEVMDEFGLLADCFDDMADSIVDSVKAALAITDMDYKIIYMNNTGLDFCKRTLEEVVGTSYSENSIYPVNTVYDPIQALNEGHEAEIYYVEEKGRYIRGVADYFMSKDGEKLGYIITSMDVTEIQLEREKAVRASSAKSDFLSNMSHEIRTPLNAIIGMTNIGKSAEDALRKDYCLGKIEEASTHLLGVINDILDVSKIEANKLTLSASEFNFEQLLQKVANIISFRADEKHQSFIVHIDERIPDCLVGDDQRLSQVLTNLLSNAVKFTPEYGVVSLDTHLIREENGVCTLQMEVNDTGIGISESQKERIFDSFEQAESSTSRKFGGTGLGLAISKRIIEMMGGEIWVESTPGEGSTFAFTVQVTRGDGARAASLRAIGQGDEVRALVVDDAAEIRDYFREISNRIGIQCDAAAGGKEAIERIKRNGDYDMYFIDWAMPEMDGIALSGWIHENCAGNPIIIMISATEWRFIENEAKRVGVTRYLPKPLFPAAIADCVHEYFHVEPKAASDAEEDADNFSAHHILLAEDVEINREIVLALLEPTGLRVDIAENGAVAVARFQEAPEKYDLIFMDLQMPEMDGFAATRAIRAMPEGRKIPIIAMTANVFREDIEKCLAAGMTAHIGKPLAVAEVMHVLREHLAESLR